MSNKNILIVLIVIFIFLYSGCILDNKILQIVGGACLLAFAVITVIPSKVSKKK